jgi:hypothetical protein
MSTHRSHRRNNNNASSFGVFSGLQTVASNATSSVSRKRGRRKSRSPGGQNVRSTEALSIATKHRKKSTPSLSALSITTDDMPIDRGRQVKSKSSVVTTQSGLSVENSNMPARPSKREKDRSKSRDSQRQHRKHPHPPSETTNRGNEPDIPPDHTDALYLAVADYTRMEKEIETLKKV